MQTDTLRAFLSVMDSGSFSRAAHSLHITQPAVSKRIGQLESELGTRLFSRTRGRVELTPAGLELAPRARFIMQSIDDSKTAIMNLSGSVTGTLSLATSHHIGLWHLPDLITTYSRHYPDVSLDLHFINSVEASDLLLRGELDLTIATLPPRSDDRLISVPVWNDRLIFVVSPEHPLARSTSVALEDLAGQPAVLPDLSTFTGRIVRQLFEQRDLSLNVTISTNYLETIRMLISIGLGWSILPLTMVDDTTRAIDVEGVSISRKLGYQHHAAHTLSNAARAFIDLLEEQRDHDVN